MSNLTAVVITKNEEENLENCLQSLKFADELVVIDDNSRDNTVQLAKKMGARVVLKKLDTFSNQRNFALKEAKNEWVLFVDADEIVSRGLKEEIIKVVSDNKFNGYYVRRVDNFLGKIMNYGDVSSVSLLRLGRKGFGNWEGDVHEKWNIGGRVSILKNSLAHYPHRTIEGFLEKINYYSSLRANELFAKGLKGGRIRIIFYPLVKFIYLYLVKRGFMDGTHGFVHAAVMSFYSFLVRGKLFQLEKDENK